MSITDLPNVIYVDQRDLSAHHNPGEFRIRFVQKASKRHKHYKTDEEIKEIKRLMSLGLTQKDVAERLGIQTRTVRKYAGMVYSKGK